MVHSPDFIFLSEAQLYQCDLSLAMETFKGEYCSSLNSKDIHDPGLPLASSSANGGTMIMWNLELDPFVTKIKVKYTKRAEESAKKEYDGSIAAWYKVEREQDGMD